MSKKIEVLTENNGSVYRIPHCLGNYVLPRTEFLLHQIKKFEDLIINWYKENKYNQGDSYHVRITNKGRWAVGHSNDYPMQHGGGSEYILTEEDFQEITKKK
jgi:hypothetical protein